ncbi:hypothetical protein PRVXH_002698 [Proteinivorax hydrogeniformans]|uniref:Membrane protein YkvI n=1 Tax=Proteinivorax hydrogeniformans TaxID=1826727 RepID=A0AAU8HTJ6_9FIRM
MKNIGVKLALTYCGAIVGAGFATGQEVVQFFSVFKTSGVVGGVLATVMFIFFAYVILDIVFKNEVRDHNDLITVVVGQKGALFFDFAIMAFLFCGFTIMLSAATTIVSTYLFPSKALSVGSFLILINVIFFKGVKGVIKVNSLLVPVLVLGVVLLCLRAIFTSVPAVNMGGLVPQNAYIAATSYVSYNLIIGMVVLSSLKSELYNKKDIFVVSIVGGMTLGIMLLLLTFATKDMPSYSQVPIIDLAYGLNQPLFYSLVLSLLIAILTSAIATGHGIINRITSLKNWNYSLIGIVLSIVALPLSFIGFSELVKAVYPFFGFVNFILMAALLLYFIKDKFVKIS